MRLKKMEQVPCEDTELILSVLEDRLRTLTQDVVREGERITMFGLGPSPRAINPRDTTVIDVHASNGVTTIDADVSFQASSFLADMPQDTIVLGKLERVFEEMKAEIDYKARRSERTTVPLPAKIEPFVEAPVAEPEAADSIAASDRSMVTLEIGLPEPEVRHEPEIASVDDPVIHPVIQEEPVTETHHALEAVDLPVAEEPKTPGAAVEEPSPVRSIFLEVPPIKTVAPGPPAVAKVRRRPIAIRRFDKSVDGEQEESKRPGRARLVVTAGVLTVVAIAGARYFAGRQGGSIPEEPVAVSAKTLPVSATTLPVSTPAPLVSPSEHPVSAPSAPVSTPASPKPAASEDPAEVVKQWETAMRGRDAAAQAAFYADPVDRYFLRDKVSKNAVAADKQAAIDKRTNGWTVRMDRVKVTRKDDAAVVSLVKHFTIRQKDEGDPVSEWFIPAQLKLKREDGRWRIVSERDLGWATSMDDLDG